MKKLALALILLPAALLFAEKPSSNPADYPVTVHVVFTRIAGILGGQRLQAIIDGQQVELQVGYESGILALGDYKAQRRIRSHAPKHPPAYESYTTYRFLLPDGTTRDFDVTGLGPKTDTMAPWPTHP